LIVNELNHNLYWLLTRWNMPWVTGTSKNENFDLNESDLFKSEIFSSQLTRPDSVVLTHLGQLDYDSGYNCYKHTHTKKGLCSLTSFFDNFQPQTMKKHCFPCYQLAKYCFLSPFFVDLWTFVLGWGLFFFFFVSISHHHSVVCCCCCCCNCPTRLL